MTTVLPRHVQFRQGTSTPSQLHTLHHTGGHSSHLMPLLSPHPSPNLSHIPQAQRSSYLSAEKVSPYYLRVLSTQYPILSDQILPLSCLFFQLNSLSILTSHMCCKLIKGKQCTSSPQQTKQSGMHPIILALTSCKEKEKVTFKMFLLTL